MKKYIFHILYIASIILALILLFTNASFPQNNVEAKPGQVVKLIWNASPDPDVWQYAIFHCQGSDTTKFSIRTGVDPDTLWNSEPITDWTYATVYDLKFHYEPKNIAGTTYLRLGVSAINKAGKYGLIQCISKVITVRRPSIITGVKVQ